MGGPVQACIYSSLQVSWGGEACVPAALLSAAQPGCCLHCWLLDTGAGCGLSLATIHSPLLTYSADTQKISLVVALIFSASSLETLLFLVVYDLWCFMFLYVLCGIHFNVLYSLVLSGLLDLDK